jgi:hypothetical protein
MALLSNMRVKVLGVALALETAWPMRIISSDDLTGSAV